MRVSYGVWLLGAAIVVPFVACTSFGSSGDDPAEDASSSPSSTSRVEPTGTSPGPTSTGPAPTGLAPPDASTPPPPRDPCLDRDAGPGIPQCNDAGAPSSVACGPQTCRDMTRLCCIDSVTARDCRDSCSGDGVVMMCDDRDDCPLGMVCCADPPAGAGIVGASSCQASCDSASLTLCTDASQCRSGICDGVGYKRCK